MNKIFFSSIIAICFLTACEPEQDESIDIGALPAAPQFTAEVLTDEPNRVAVAITSDGYFDYVWDAPEALPATSKLVVDTFFYQSAGEHVITLHAAAEGGSGTASSSQTVTILEDAMTVCDETLELLTNNCAIRCWKMSEAPGGVKVGPVPLSGEWYTSPGLDVSQINDRWCFEADGLAHTYDNGGSTFSACQGFVEVANYPIPVGVTYSVLPSSSTFADFEITLSEGWMGVEDSGPFYEIISISETELTLLTPTKPCDGSPTNGWFTLVFEAD